jgi:hypothetical protein
MWELLAVLTIYLAVSFLGMAALWTVAIRKGVVRAPSYFFWIRADESPALPNTLSNFGPLGLVGATAALVYALSTPPQTVANNGLGGGMALNQMAPPSALAGS